MPPRSPDPDAVVRAVDGADDLDAVRTVQSDLQLARVIALAPNTHPFVRTLAARRGGLTSLLTKNPDDAARRGVDAPWGDLPADIRAAILECADRSPVCAAVAAARGRRDATMLDITQESAVAFFTALDPRVWDALDGEVRRRWLHALPDRHVFLAIRSLGLRPELLVRAQLDNDLVHAARRHAPDDAALRAALLPVALRTVYLAAARVLIAAWPLPDDPGAFFCIASGQRDPSVIDRARAALRTPDDLACAVALQRQKDIVVWTPSFGALLQHALHGRSYDDLAPILALLTDDARADLMPDREEVGARLAHPDHRERMRAVIDRLAALPPTVAFPTQVALHRWVTRRAPPSAAADVVAAALHAHGDILLAIADGLADAALRDALLPLPRRKKTATALRTLVRDDPIGGRALACALRRKDRRRTLLALLTAPPQHAAAVWQALEDSERHCVASSLPNGGLTDAALARSDPLAALALQALQSSDPDLRDAGGAALASRKDMIRSRWCDLTPNARHVLGSHPSLAIAVADLGRSSPSATNVRRRRIHR